MAGGRSRSNRLVIFHFPFASRDRTCFLDLPSPNNQLVDRWKLENEKWKMTNSSWEKNEKNDQSLLPPAPGSCCSNFVSVNPQLNSNPYAATCEINVRRLRVALTVGPPRMHVNSIRAGPICRWPYLRPGFAVRLLCWRDCVPAPLLKRRQQSRNQK